MTAYTVISDTSLDPDAPITSALGYAFRNNPIAIAEGASGAPRVRIGALQRLSAGTNVRIRRDNPASSTSGTALDFALLQSGEIRITFDRRNAGTTITLTRIRGTTSVVIYNGDPDTPQTFDVSVLPGDVITLKWTGSISSQGIINARMSTGGEDYFPINVAAGFLEGNTYNG